MTAPSAGDVLARLAELGEPERLPDMARFGIDVSQAFGVRIPELRALAKRIGKSRSLADALWANGGREARILASMIDEPKRLDEARIEAWTAEFSSWEICDQVCANLYEKSPLAWDFAIRLHDRAKPYVKRTAFSLMARLAVSDKKSPDARFLPFFPLCLAQAGDDRVPVKKAVNWAIRQMGKRSKKLREEALAWCDRILALGTPQARFIAKDAIRELNDPKILARIKR